MKQHTDKTQQFGMSLIELMVAVVIGLLIVGVVLGLFINSNKNYIQDNTYARMQENGRFAMKYVSADLRMLSFWGRVTDTSGISNPGALGPTCGITIDANNPIMVLNGPTGVAAKAIHGCLDDTKFVGGTDVLVIKRTQGCYIPKFGEEVTKPGTTDPIDEECPPHALPAVSQSTPGMIYLRITGSSNSGELYAWNGTADTDAGKKDWMFISHIYYVRNKTVNGNNIPTLFRKTLNKNIANPMVDEEIAEGVQNMQIQFGIDSDNDGDIDFYTANPTAAQLALLITVRINLLVRAANQDPNSTYVNNKTYNLGEGTVVGPFNDRFQRRVYTSTVPVRNIFQIKIL